MMNLDNLHLAYGSHTVIKGASAQWEGGQMIMLVGENGTGKSTLLKSMLGLVPYEGSLDIDGCEIKEMKPSERAKRFAYVAQQKPLPIHEKAEDFLLTGVAYRLNLFEQPSTEDMKKVDNALKLFDLEHLKHCYLDELSGGEVQMLYVARCFAGDHDMLILDEPCSYLDYHKQYAFLQRVKEMLKKKNMGAIISIHDPNLALMFADYMVCLHHQKIFAEQKIDSLQDKKKMAEVLNGIYHQAFHITEQYGETLMQWKSDN